MAIAVVGSGGGASGYGGTDHLSPEDLEPHPYGVFLTTGEGKVGSKFCTFAEASQFLDDNPDAENAILMHIPEDEQVPVTVQLVRGRFDAFSGIEDAGRELEHGEVA